jgi:hypothetical protein
LKRRAAARRFALFGAISVIFCGASIGLLHILPSDRRLNPVSAPISDYALTSAAWLFDTSVLILATGVAAVLAALVLGGYLPRASAPFATMSTCCAALVVVVIFPDRALNGMLGPSAWVHWSAAMLAFGGLPLASTLLRRLHRSPWCHTRLPGVARALSLTAGACFLALFVGSILDLATSWPIWRVGGIVERVLAIAEMGVTVLMAIWAWAGCACTTLPPLSALAESVEKGE